MEMAAAIFLTREVQGMETATEARSVATFASVGMRDRTIP